MGRSVLVVRRFSSYLLCRKCPGGVTKHSCKCGFSLVLNVAVASTMGVQQQVPWIDFHLSQNLFGFVFNFASFKL